MIVALSLQDNPYIYKEKIMTVTSRIAVLLLFVSSLLVTSCGQWVDNPMGSCKEDYSKEISKDAMIPRAICANAGKSFTGKVRCKDGRKQVHCE